MKLLKIGFYSFMVLAGMYISLDANSDLVMDMVMERIANA